MMLGLFLIFVVVTFSYVFALIVIFHREYYQPRPDRTKLAADLSIFIRDAKLEFLFLAVIVLITVFTFLM